MPPCEQARCLKLGGAAQSCRPSPHARTRCSANAIWGFPFRMNRRIEARLWRIEQRLRSERPFFLVWGRDTEDLEQRVAGLRAAGTIRDGLNWYGAVWPHAGDMPAPRWVVDRANGLSWHETDALFDAFSAELGWRGTVEVPLGGLHAQTPLSRITTSALFAYIIACRDQLREPAAPIH